MGDFKAKGEGKELIPKILIEYEGFAFFDQDLKVVVKNRAANEKMENGVAHTLTIVTSSHFPQVFEYSDEKVRDENFEQLMRTLTQSLIINKAKVETTKSQNDEEDEENFI